MAALSPARPRAPALGGAEVVLVVALVGCLLAVNLTHAAGYAHLRENVCNTSVLGDNAAGFRVGVFVAMSMVMCVALLRCRDVVLRPM